MTKRPRTIPPSPVALEIVRGHDIPLGVQVREQIANLVTSGDLASGARLPPVRMLAEQLNINQMTVAKAYKDLGDAGFLEARRGGGTFVRAVNRPRQQNRTGFRHTENRPLLSERLFDLARAPGVISFTSNFPQPETKCLEEFRTCVSTVLEEQMETLFRYEAPGGRPELRRQVIELLKQVNIAASEDNILITSGGQQAIDLVVRTLLSPVTPVIVERPAYYGAINVMRSIGARILEVPLESDGMDLNVLEEYLKRYRPRCIYVNPTFQNPTGITTSESKRRGILQLARQYGAIILEDDHCPELRFSGAPVPPIRALAEPDDAVIYVRGFGKVYLPGLRLGFVVAPPSMQNMLRAAKANADLHSNALIQEAFALFLARGKYRSSMTRQRNAYAAQQKLLRERLLHGMPPSTLIGDPDGGLSLWLTLPDGARVTDLYYRAVRHGVAFVSGEAFYASNSDLRTLRISFGHIDEHKLLEGVERLCSLVHDLSRPARSQALILS